jgi:hypothetical protein
MVEQEIFEIVSFNNLKILRGMAGVEFVFRVPVKRAFHKNLVTILTTDELVH